MPVIAVTDAREKPAPKQGRRGKRARPIPAPVSDFGDSFSQNDFITLLAHESGFTVAVDRTQDGPYAGRRVTLLLPS